MNHNSVSSLGGYTGKRARTLSFKVILLVPSELSSTGKLKTPDLFWVELTLKKVPKTILQICVGDLVETIFIP